MSREYTKEECTEMFMQTVKGLVKYWQRESHSNRDEAIEGIAHSLLCIFDGVNGELPAFAIVPLPHGEDKSYSIEMGEDYWPESDMEGVIDIAEAKSHLHDMLYK